MEKMTDHDCMRARAAEGLLMPVSPVPDTLQARRTVAAVARQARDAGVPLSTLVAGVRERADGEGLECFVATRVYLWGEREWDGFYAENGLMLYEPGSEVPRMLDVDGPRMVA